MNIINTVQNGFSARLFAGITIVSLLLSAFPVAFFVAQAANTDAVGFITLSVIPSNSTGPETVAVTFDGTGTLSLTDWAIWDTLSSESKKFAFGAVTLTDGQTYTICHDGSCDGVSSGGATVWNDAGDTAQLRDENDVTIVATTWGAVVTDTEYTNVVAVDYAPVGPTGPVENTDTGEFFATVQEAIDDADTDNGDTIVMSADETTSLRININKEITLDGGGFTIDAAFTKADISSPNDNNAAITITGTDNVTVRNIVLDGANGTNLHGINVYESTGITVENVTSSNFRSGMVVNGSTVDASNFSTEGNIWHGINVAPGSGVTAPSVLNISNTSSHAEVAPVAHIFTDNINAGPTIIVNDIDDQYDVVEDIDPRNSNTYRAYFLKAEEPKKVDICHFHQNGFNAINVSVNSIQNAHGDDTEDIIPVIPGIYPTGQNLDTLYGSATGAEVLANDCVVPMPPSNCNYVNLLTNGSFEEPEVTNSSKWQKFSTVPGWSVTKVSDDTPTTLELMRGIFGNQAADGDQYAELDGDHSTKIAQTVSGLELRGEYELSWAFAGRHDINADQNQLDVLVNGSSVATEGPQSDPQGLAFYDWTRSSYTFTAMDDEVEIAFADLGPSNSFGTYLDDARLCLVAEPEPVVNISATKIVCDYESELPNWSGSVPGDLVTADTASDWLTAQGEDTTCRVVDWEFEWADRSAKNPGNAFVGAGGSDWTTFSGSTEVPLSEVDSKSFWVREVLPAEYIPFGGSNSKNDVSAEMYCHKDGLNYDNFDRIDSPKVDETYHCVAWNVPKELPPQTCSIFSDTNTLVVDTNEDAVETYVHNNWTKDIDGDAAWVWATDRVENPAASSTYTFAESFTVDDPTAATVQVAADNLLLIRVNGVVVLDQTDQNNFSIVQTVDILSALNPTGENTIEFEVTNLAGQNDYQKNPAGVLYRIDIESKVACEVTTAPVPPATLAITSPATENEVLSGVHTFTANYNDNDDEVDAIQWAIRPGVCETSDVNLAGNVGGLSDASTFTGNTFSADVDMTAWLDGPYCFVVNPNEGDDEDLRETQTFILENNTDPVLPPVTSCSFVNNLAINDTPSQGNVASNLTSFSLNDLAYTTGDEFDLFVSGDTAANGSFSDEVVVERTTDGLRLFFYGTGVNGGPVTEFSGSFTLNGVDLTSAVIAADSEPNEAAGSWPDVFEINQTTGEVTFTLFTNSGNDSFVISGLSADCGVNEPDTYTISGVKYEVDGETETPAAGWTIYASNGVGTPLSTTTDENGYYYFDVPADKWEVYEEDRENWDLVDIFQYPMLYFVSLFEEEQTEQVSELEQMTACVFDLGFEPTASLVQDTEVPFATVNDSESEGYTCNFYNEYTAPEDEEDEETVDPAPQRTSSRSSGTRTNRSLPQAAPAPLVLGASTDQCPFLVDYMQMGTNNDQLEVMKLQMFLNIFRTMFGGTENPVTGNFGIITDTNVKKFQEFYKDEILQPWFNQGIVGHTKPTGFVYKTTLWKINSIVCPDSAVLPDLTGETLQTNTDLNARAVQD